MSRAIDDITELVRYIDDHYPHWVEGKDMKRDLNLSQSPRQIGQALRPLKDDPRYEIEKKNHINWYRLKDGSKRVVPQGTPQLVFKKTVIKDLSEEVSKLSKELTELGVNVEELFYLYLKNTKEQLDNEMKKTPLLADMLRSNVEERKKAEEAKKKAEEEKKQLEQQLKTERNQKQDLKDKLDKKAADDLYKVTTDERKVKDGVIG